MHENFPDLLNDTLSLSNIMFHRTASQEAVCILVDLDGIEHPSNPEGRPSPHGTIPFNAYDRMLVKRGKTSPDSWDYKRASLYTPNDEVNTASPYRRYRHIFEALFYILLWCISGVPDQTLGWMERGHVRRDEFLCLLKHPKERESFMWDATEIFARIGTQFEPLIEAWLKPLWMLVSEAHFTCRNMPEEDRCDRLDGLLTLNKVVEIIRGEGDHDLRIAALIPLPSGEDSDML